MKAALDAAGKREAALIAPFGLTPEDFRRFRSPGSRREAILNPLDLGVSEVDEGLRFTFTLPSGAYATTVLREFTRLALKAAGSPTIRIKGGHKEPPLPYVRFTIPRLH